MRPRHNLDTLDLSLVVRTAPTSRLCSLITYFTSTRPIPPVPPSARRLRASAQHPTSLSLPPSPDRHHRTSTNDKYAVRRNRRHQKKSKYIYHPSMTKRNFIVAVAASTLGSTPQVAATFSLVATDSQTRMVRRRPPFPARPQSPRLITQHPFLFAERTTIQTGRWCRRKLQQIVGYI